MQSRFTLRLVALLLGGSILAAAGCGSEAPSAPNRPPNAVIGAPPDGATVPVGDAVSFDASGSADPDGAIRAHRWEFGDGATATGSTASHAYSAPGSFTVSVTVEDGEGATGRASIQVTVNAAPSAAVESPPDGATVVEGTEVTFEGSATDPEDGALTGQSLTWRSDVDGELGTGETVRTGGLSVGEHTVTLEAEDSRGATAEASVSITVEENGAPTPTIESPADGAAFAEGEAVILEGSAEDPEDGVLTGESLTWRSDVNGELGTGETVTVGSLSVGEHRIALEAADSRGATSETSVSVTVEENRAPSASISGPSDGATFAEGEAVTLEGSAEDPEDGALAGGSLAWRSDVDGELGTGETVTVGSLSVGEHRITLEAADSQGATGEASIGITVEENAAPTASITGPASGATFSEGETIAFEGSGEDPEDGSLTGSSLVWRSSLDGRLGTGETVSTSTLSVGTHTVTLTVTDGEGATGQASITVHVEAGNAAPTASIRSPPDGAQVAAGQTVTFEGSATDPEDGSLTGSSLVWRSSLEGQLGTGETVSTSALSVGTHTISLTATDDEGATGQASISVTVEDNDPPSVQIDAPGTRSVFAEGTGVGLEGSATDPEDGTLSGSSLAWSSDVDGALGSGSGVTATGLSTGPHTVTLTATDSDGASASSSIEILVEGSGYDIRVRFLSSFTSGERGTILEAVGTWEAVVTGDLSPAFPSQGGECDEGGRGIDDLLVSVKAVSIDGPGGTLARAGPCLLRSTNRLPIAGVVEIDQADLGSSALSDVVEHEIGHVLGIGISQVSGWGGALRDLSTLDPYFAGSSAVAEFEGMGGQAYLSDPVPLANQGGGGTAGVHWREANLQSELMTGFIGGGASPLSVVTVAAMADIGYTVNAAAAEPFTLPMPQTALWEATADATLARPADSGVNYGLPGSSGLSTAIVAGTNAAEDWEPGHPDDELYAGLVRFGVPSLPSGVSIGSAEVLLAGAGSDGSGTLELVRVTGPWSEGAVNWDGRPGLGSAVASFAVGSCCGGTTGSLTDLARGWANGSTSNHGLALLAPDAGSGNLYSAGFRTRHASAGNGRPFLRVTASTGGSVQAFVAPGEGGRGRPLGDDVLVDLPLYVVTPDGETRRIR